MPLYMGERIDFPGTFLARKYAYNPDDEKRAGDAIRTTFSATWKPGKDAVEHMNEIERRALARIAQVGAGAFADEVEQRFGARKEAAE